MLSAACYHGEAVPTSLVLLTVCLLALMVCLTEVDLSA